MHHSGISCRGNAVARRGEEYVGWVERSETHRSFAVHEDGGFRWRSTHPTNFAERPY
jgi:hypothetical protein